VQAWSVVFQLNISNKFSFCASISRPNAKPETVSTNFMTTLRNIILSTFTIGLVACNTKTNDKRTEDNSVSTIKSLAGQVYFFAPELDTTTCEATGGCDCCSSDILFLDNTSFITISYCESDEQIFRGTYQIDYYKVYLHYDTLEIDKEYNWEMETDTTGAVKTEYFIKTQKTESNEIILTALTCKGQIWFKTGDKEISYGSLDKKTSLDKHIQRLKDQGIWDKLK
jgi:hypothetical protein